MTVVQIPESLVAEVVETAAPDRDDVSSFVAEAVRHALARRRARDLEPPVIVAPVGGNNCLPDVDLSRWAHFLNSQAATARAGATVNA